MQALQDDAPRPAEIASHLKTTVERVDVLKGLTRAQHAKSLPEPAVFRRPDAVADPSHDAPADAIPRAGSRRR
jgi:hypothetical protein